MSGASLGVFRIAFGLIGVVSVFRLIGRGWATTRYAGPAHRFTYLGFGWVPKPGEAAMLALLAVVGAAAAAVAVGRWYRPAIVIFFVGFTWIELIDVTTYLNHYVFVSLMAFLLCFLPADARFSWAARRRGPRSVPVGVLWLLRAQVAVVYVFAGVAKLHGDWLVHALPLRLWLPALEGLGPLDGLLDHAWTATAFSVAGALFDCTIVPLLAWRRTRLMAFAAVVAFHVVTWRLFPIGVFPWLMIAAASLFFAPDWPERTLRRVGLQGSGSAAEAPPAPVTAAAPASSAHPAVVTLALVGGVAWVVLQVLLPLRHVLYAGDARWTNEGYRFAWNVLAVERAGDVSFRLRDPATGETWVDDARSLYTDDQWRLMATEPDLIHQAALALAAQARADGHRTVEVRADAYVSLNGRPAAPLIDPTVDLAAERRDLWHDDWIAPAPSSPPP